MPDLTTAYLICIYNSTGGLLKRRIALTRSDAICFVDAHAEKLGATVTEDSNDYSGHIHSDTKHFGTYTIANIAVV